MKTVLLTYDPKEKLPPQSGVYACLLKDDFTKEFFSRRIYFSSDKNKFHLKARCKECEVVKWYRAIEIDDNEFANLERTYKSKYKAEKKQPVNYNPYGKKLYEPLNISAIVNVDCVKPFKTYSVNIVWQWKNMFSEPEYVFKHAVLRKRPITVTTRHANKNTQEYITLMFFKQIYKELLDDYYFFQSLMERDDSKKALQELGRIINEVKRRIRVADKEYTNKFNINSLTPLKCD